MYTTSCVWSLYKKEKHSRYSFHYRLDADHRVLLLEAVAQFQILPVGVSIKAQHEKNQFIRNCYLCYTL